MWKPSEMGKVVEILMFFISVISLLGFNCSAQTQPQSQMTPQVREFYRIIHAELAQDGECKAALEYLGKLSPRAQLDVARAILNNADARVGYLGDSVLI